MARTKQIEDTILLELIKKYFYEECHNDIKKLKTIEITKYINNNGYPDYRVTTLRRTQVAIDYIEELKKSISDNNFVTLVSYQTIDAAALVESNRSRARLIQAITERDCYYKTVADSAVQSLDKYNQLKQKYDTVKDNNTALTTKIEELEELVADYKAEIKILKSELSANKSVIDTYIYPEIANELLVKEGAIRKTENPLKENILESALVTTTTNVKQTAKSGSNVINGLFNILED